MRKDGYPFRLEFENFYRRYHELDAINKKISIDKHIKMNSDLPKLIKEMVIRIMPNSKNIVMFGLTKIYMKP